jgi:hypothetical protein
MSDCIDQEEEHKEQVEAKHQPNPGLDVMKMAGVQNLNKQVKTLTPKP